MKGKQDNKSKELDYWGNTSLLGKLERPVYAMIKRRERLFFVGFEFHIRRGSVFFCAFWLGAVGYILGIYYYASNEGKAGEKHRF